MKEDSAKFDLLKRYLLGQLAEEEMQSIEQQYLADESCFYELLNAETELIAQYQSGQLSPEEREQLDGYFLRSAERRARAKASLVQSESNAEPVKHQPKKWWLYYLTRLGFFR